MHILQAWKTEHRLFHALLIALDLSLVQTRTKRWNDDKNKTTNTKQNTFNFKWSVEQMTFSLALARLYAPNNNNNSNNDVNDGAICSQ